jgi:hypothetical protein
VCACARHALDGAKAEEPRRAELDCESSTANALASAIAFIRAACSRGMPGHRLAPRDRPTRRGLTPAALTENLPRGRVHRATYSRGTAASCGAAGRATRSRAGATSPSCACRRALEHAGDWRGAAKIGAQHPDGQLQRLASRFDGGSPRALAPARSRGRRTACGVVWLREKADAVGLQKGDTLLITRS